MPFNISHRILSVHDIYTFHCTTYTPEMTFVLHAMVVDEEALSSIQMIVLKSMIMNKMRYASTTPTVFGHGPITMLGGIDLLDLCTEIGISQMKYLRDAVYSDSEAGRLIILSIKYMQRESGKLAVPLLENPSIHISYLTPTWITSSEGSLFQHNIQISLTDTVDIKLTGKHDQCIMNSEFLFRYTPIQQLNIN